MALDAGVLSLTVEFAQGLKDQDFFGRMDPYAIVTVGSQTYRTKTIKSGGTNPVFNEVFRFNIINENSFNVVLKDDDIGKDDMIGQGQGDLAKVRMNKTDRVQIMMNTHKGKQKGFVSINLSFEPNSGMKPAGAPGAAPYAQPPPQYAYPQAPPPGQPYYPPAYVQPPPYGAQPYGAPPPGAPYSYPPQQGYAPPPGAPGAYPPAPYGAPPPQQYPPPGYGAPPPQGYGYGAPPAPPCYHQH